MYVVTGCSDKRDGILFVAKDAKTSQEAMAALLASLNSINPEAENQLMLATDENGQDYLLNADFEGDVDEFDGEAPRWEGWLLYCGEVDEDGWCDGAMCW